MKKKMNNPSWCCKQIQSQIEDWKQDIDETSAQEIIDAIEKIFYDLSLTAAGEDSSMKVNRNIGDGNLFLFLEKPFLVIYRDTDKQVGYVWLGSKEESLSTIKTLKECEYTILEAIEIGSYRNIM